MKLQLTATSILCAILLALPVHHACGISAEELAANYMATLAKQQRFAFKFTDSATRDAQSVTPIMQKRDGRTTFSASGELICDGRRIALRMKDWGQIRSHQAIPASNPRYKRTTYDGRELWSYFRNPTNKGEPYGRLFMAPNAAQWQVWDILRISYPGHYLLGYMSECGIRMDEIFRDRATKLALRPGREKVGSAECYVLDVSSRFGRGTLWLDPEHGFNMAQAYRNVRSGDIANNKPVVAGIDAHIFLKDVRFQLVNGVWFPVQATVETKAHRQGDFEAFVRQHRITGVKLNPDMDAMSAFSIHDIPNGAECIYIPNQAKFIWQSGMLVPAGR